MSKFTMMDTKNSEKCYMGAVMVIFDGFVIKC